MSGEGGLDSKSLSAGDLLRTRGYIKWHCRRRAVRGSSTIIKRGIQSGIVEAVNSEGQVIAVRYSLKFKCIYTLINSRDS